MLSSFCGLRGVSFGPNGMIVMTVLTSKKLWK